MSELADAIVESGRQTLIAAARTVREPRHSSTRDHKGVRECTR